nr:CgpM [Actinoalloteichus caeruleus]
MAGTVRHWWPDEVLGPAGDEVALVVEVGT